MKLVIDNTDRYPDFPVGIRFVPVPKPMFTADELLWACFFTGLVSMLFTCGMALVLAW